MVDGDAIPYVVGQMTTCKEAVVDPETLLELLGVLEVLAVLEEDEEIEEDEEEEEEEEVAWGLPGASLQAARPTASRATNGAATAILCICPPPIVLTD